MSRRGSYLGGHTVITPRAQPSAAALKRRKPHPANPEQILVRKEGLQKQRKAAQRARRLKQEREIAEAASKPPRPIKKLPPPAKPHKPRGSPEKIAERLAVIASRKAAHCAKMAEIEIVRRKRVRRVDPLLDEGGTTESEPLVFSPEEIDALKRHLSGYEKLVAGKAPANTAARRHFLDVASGRTRAESIHEIAFVKYRRWQAEQRANGLPEAALETSIGEKAYPNHVWEKLKNARWRLPPRN